MGSLDVMLNFYTFSSHSQINTNTQNKDSQESNASEIYQFISIFSLRNTILIRYLGEYIKRHIPRPHIPKIVNLTKNNQYLNISMLSVTDQSSLLIKVIEHRSFKIIVQWKGNYTKYVKIRRPRWILNIKNACTLQFVELMVFNEPPFPSLMNFWD